MTFQYGQKVSILPMERETGRVVCVYHLGNGFEYDVRYFRDGEAKTCRFFENELEAVGA